MSPEEKPQPAWAEFGLRGARRRWGEPRVVRIAELTPQQRRLVLALVDAARKEAAPVIVTSEAAEEVRGASHERPSAA
jgi:hypothetical protein